MKIFETKEDIQNEREVIKEFCKKFECDFFKLPKFDIDFLIHRNDKVVAFAEIKCKKNNFKSYSKEFIGLHKYFSLKKYSEIYPTFLIIRFFDGIYYINLKQIPTDNIKYGGRKIEREDATNDKEWLVNFDRILFKKL